MTPSQSPATRLRGRLQLLVLGAVLAAVFAACGDDDSGASNSAGSDGEGGEYVVGGLADLSGPFAASGGPLSNGFRAAIEMINRDGGVDGHPIRLIVRDDASDPARGLEHVREFATKEKASAIIGLNSSVVGAAAAPAVAQAKIPMIGSGLPSDLIDPVQPYVFVSKTDFESQARAMVEFVKQQSEAGELPQDPRLSLLYYSTPAGEQWHDAAVEQAKEGGVEIVSSQSAQVTATDLSAQVAKTAAAKPDAILTFLNAPGLTNAVTQMKRVGVSPATLLMGFNATTSAPFMKDLQWKNFVSLADVRSPDAEDNETFATMQEGAKALKTDPNTPSFLDGYMQGLIVAAALEKCGYPCPGEELQQALDGLTLDGGGLTWGPYEYSPDSHAPVTQVQFERWNEQDQAREPVGDPIQLK